MAYDLGLFQSRKFNLPIICVGNLAVGGAGKTPMTEYLIRLLGNKYRTAVLSRGYGRKVKGFRLVEFTDTPLEAGDEPLQFRRKFKNITVAVSEKRATGIEILQDKHHLIILDDAFQHRAVKAGLNILLFDYTRLFEPLVVLPAGNLRDSFSQRARANLIVITKTPEHLTAEQREAAIRRIRPLDTQKVFFSYLSYGSLRPVFKVEQAAVPSIESQSTIFLLTGIANPYPLLTRLEEAAAKVIHHDYPDHHVFSKKNIAKLAEAFKSDPAEEKLIVTTEKDAQRLGVPELEELLKDLPVYYLPVEAKFHQAEEELFNSVIEAYVTRDLQHN